MYTPAADTGVTVVEEDATLSNAYSPVDYMSITSFPRLPEDEVSADNTIKTRKDDDNFLADPDLFLKSARLQRLPSSASDLASHDVSPLRETNRDPLAQECACTRDGLTVIITACLTFATGVTVALIMQIYFGEPQVYSQAAVVTDVSRCTTLGLDVLGKQGSSVDAAIAASLCLGIIHPHSSGIGGGGVMLVHDIRKNESRVIDFRETAPSGLHEDMMQHASHRPGLTVAVPGLISGLHQAHQLYGRMSWKNVVSMAADVARNGFNITHELADALSKVKQQNVSDSFRDVFLPAGQPPLAGLFARRLDLAALLDKIAANGILEFYSSNLTQEMTSAVQANGGVLTEEDFRNYTTVIQTPLQSLYQGQQVFVPPPPQAGVALLSALNILEGFNISSQTPRSSVYHWVAESLKIALSQASGLGDSMFDSSVSELVAEMLSSLNRPFGSGIVTSSGILLNSQILDFSWPNKTLSSSAFNQRNSIAPGKRPLSFLLPLAVRPSVGQCGTYIALGSCSGDRALSGITQVLVNVLSSRRNMSESVSSGRLHPLISNNSLLVDSVFQEADVKALQAKGHDVLRVERLSLVEGTRRTNDLIIGVKDPRSSDAAALSMAMP
ncbi:glutathione hydrolase 7 isoform X4 [Danio rerio]|uniref:Glutathione hydrolase 7 isoform X4 n=1 Tax=Danio rerio TaxID=7955 RepID=A0AC58ING4_DANRE